MPDRRACQNDRDHAGGDWCPGWLTFEAGQPQGRCDTCGAWYGVLANSDPSCPRQDGWNRKRETMPDYRDALNEMIASVRIMRGDADIPFRLAIGTSAYIRLREILDHRADPGVPNAWGSAPRSLLLLSGLPITVEEKWPPNLWAVLDRDGNAIQGGILNALPTEGDER